VSFQLPLITLASCALLWLIFWAWQAHKRLVVEDFVDYTDAQPGAGVKGLATLVVTRLGQLHDLYRTVDEQRAIRTSVSQNESIDANIEVEDVSEFLKDAVSIQSTLHLGPLEIPAGALLSLFGRIVQGPRIIGSLHKDKTLLILIAQIVGWKYPFKWQVVIPLSSVELADSHSYNLVEMVDELASRMFTDLTLDGSVRWKAMAAFSKGLQAYRECLRTPKNRRVNLKEAEKKFIETLAEDVEFGLAYYNLGVVYTELGRTEAAEIAFEKAITQNPDSWYSYYALALSRCEYRRYYRAIQLCKRVIELKPDRASIAKAYQLMGSAQRRLPGQSLEEQEKGVAQGQSDRQIPAKESTIKSISHSWIALCSAELRGQGKGTTERSKISQLETLASICLADLATFYIEDADPKEVGQVRTISKDEVSMFTGREATQASTIS
jgi:tetratricopeptide (TPR) repeat protein